MAQTVLLNNQEHRHLRVITERSEKYGDNLWYSLTFPLEYRFVQAYYPIFFQKDSETGKFFSVALFGFQQDENLFLNDEGWDAAYIPLAQRRQPFLIGSAKQGEKGAEQIQRVLHIDLDNPRVSESEGEPLFHEFGSNTEFLDNIADMMEALHQGVVDGEQFIDALVSNELLESFSLDVELNDGSKHQMLGFYTINEDVLANLSSDVLSELHKNGWLEAIYMVVASQQNIRHLLDRKNARVENMVNPSTDEGAVENALYQ